MLAVISCKSPTYQSLEIGPHHRAPVAEVVVKERLLKKQCQAEHFFPFVNTGDRVPDRKDERKNSDFGEGIFTCAHLPADLQPKLPIQKVFLFSGIAIS